MNLQFTKIEKGEGSRVIGTLTWGDDSYSVITGGYGLGEIPNGSYIVKTRNVAEGDSTTMKSGFLNPATGRGWFIPLEAKFNTSRFGFGIHPDGNLPGTKGCLGLQGDDIDKFFSKWLTTPLTSRPTTLHVTSDL
ncbi:L,D-transpeptidase [Neptunomonas phycophila]|uniref:L,D-transpeptidase n=1 Tax=Neptunomonas phycophila TaxID=1572645 RepID=A0ABT9ESV8_9GAMM|nr:L,D-transpeptidase [Neptunomonas phycophila]MDP2522061.1 L,D-transpeptidase [Neptunomonas phycophila]